VDYIFRWLATKFLSQEAQYHAGVNNREDRRIEERPAAGASTDQHKRLVLPHRGTAFQAVSEPKNTSNPTTYAAAAIQNQEDAPPCSMCGSIMVRSGSCYKCANCGSTSGCA
jgi:ribonucleoside-diphosphate reductase alpha chain